MLLRDRISYKKDVNIVYKIILFLFFLFFSPGLFRFLDHSFQKYIGLYRFINIFDFIFFGFLIVCFFKRSKIKNYLSSPLAFFIFFLILSRISLFFSKGEIHHKAYYDLFKTFFCFSLFFIFFTPFFRKNYKKIIKGFLVIFFTVALFESIIGIMQFILQKPLGGFSLFLEPKFGVGIENSAVVFISENKQFFFNKILNNHSSYFLRAHGSFFHPNIFSGFLNVSSIMTLYLIYKTKKKITFSFFLSIQLIALIFTFSRAGLISFVCISFLFFFLMHIKKYEIKKMFLVFLSILFLIMGIFSKYLIERGYVGKPFQSKKAKEMSIGSKNIRSSLKNVSVNMIKKHPFLGVGFRNFLIKKNEYTNENLERAYVHNIYLLIASETGLIALLAFISIIVIIFINTIRYCLNPLNIAVICAIVSFLFIGFFDHYPISSFLGKIILFTFLGFLNYSIEVNKRFSYFQKAFLCQ